MKRMILAAVALALVTSAAIAENGREAGQWFVRAGVGAVFPKSNNLTVPGVGTVDVDEAYAITLTGGYMITDWLGIELLASTPWTHDVNLKGVGKIGETKQLPPTLSLQWYTPNIGRIQPYVGVGINWTIFFDEKTEGALAGTRLNLDDSVGVAPQVGVDFNVNENWMINADVRWANIETDATVDGSDIGEVKIDPWVVSFNVGYRF